MNQFYLVTLRRGVSTQEFYIGPNEATDKFLACAIAKSRAFGIGWVVAEVETGLVLAPVSGLTS